MYFSDSEFKILGSIKKKKNLVNSFSKYLTHIRKQKHTEFHYLMLR